MKRIITSAITAMLLSLGIVFAHENIKISDVIYVINHNVVASSLFDGSQLMNKTIASYQVDSKLGLHVIFTSDYTKEKKINQTKVLTKDGDIMVVSYDNRGNAVATTTVASHPDFSNAFQAETVYVVDGRLSSSEEFMSISPSKIDSMTVIKSKNDPDFRKYAKANTEVVMMITTK